MVRLCHELGQGVRDILVQEVPEQVDQLEHCKTLTDTQLTTLTKLITNCPFGKEVERQAHWESLGLHLFF